MWLSLNQIANLFGRDKSVISRHIKNIFNDKELQPNQLLQNLQLLHQTEKIMKSHITI
jgi:hypothetical protein